MNAPDFFKWAKDRRVCIRGALHIRGRSSFDFWNQTGRGDWLCWVLDWTNEPHPAKRQMWERPWWKTFLFYLYDRSELTDKEKFERFNKWDTLIRPTHDETLKMDFGKEWNFARGANGVRHAYNDPLIGKIYVPFDVATGYVPEKDYPNDYPIEHIQEVLGIEYNDPAKPKHGGC